MPICEADAWRLQYFENVDCPADIRIPTEDSDAWAWNPAHRWVYDKLSVALTQNISAAPHGVPPGRFPVFSKPLCNLRGMAVGSRALMTRAEYDEALTPGHMWMELLRGDHISSDAALIDGAPVWWRHAHGHSAGGGTFDYWAVQARRLARIENDCGTWVRRHLRGYTGMVNFETIGAKIIEVHLRFSDQWPDLYGPGWMEALVALYSTGRWPLSGEARRTGYSVALFGPHGTRYLHPPRRLVAQLLENQALSSIQITFDDQLEPDRHAMPPGGFRLALVNCWDLSAGMRARECLRQYFLGARIARLAAG